MGRFDLTDDEWAIIEPLLPPQGHGPERKDDREVLNGIFYILRTGAPWRDLPECQSRSKKGQCRGIKLAN